MANLSDILPPSNLVTDSSTDTLTNKTLTSPKINEDVAVTSTATELNLLDGVTAVVGELNALDLGSTAVGTAIASKAVILDANKDYTGIRNFTITGELDAATLDISGNADIDGTTNLDAVDIDGAVQVDGATTFGVDDTGVDVKFFGATSGAYLLWDESADKLLTAGGTTIDVGKDKLLIGSTAVTTTAAELNILDGVTATTAELNYLDLATLGSTAASKVVSADANGVVRFTKGIVEEVVDVTSSISSNAVALDLQASTNFIVDLNGVSSALTLTFSNDPPDAGIFTVKVIQGSSDKTITWQGDVDWPGGTAPTLSSGNDKVDVFVFLTVDGGTTFYGFTAGQALA